MTITTYSFFPLDEPDKPVTQIFHPNAETSGRWEGDDFSGSSGSDNKDNLYHSELSYPSENGAGKDQGRRRDRQHELQRQEDNSDFDLGDFFLANCDMILSDDKSQHRTQTVTVPAKRRQSAIQFAESSRALKRSRR